MSTVSSSYSGLPRTRKRKGSGNNVVTSADGKRVFRLMDLHQYVDRKIKRRRELSSRGKDTK